MIDISPDKVDVAPLISHVLPLESAATGFSLLTSAARDAAKVLLKPA